MKKGVVVSKAHVFVLKAGLIRCGGCFDKFAVLISEKLSDRYYEKAIIYTAQRNKRVDMIIHALKLRKISTLVFEEASILKPKKSWVADITIGFEGAIVPLVNGNYEKVEQMIKGQI